MKELDKALNVAARILVKGKQREEALAAFDRQIQEWNVALPKVDALIWDFGLGDHAKVGLIEYWVANELDAGYCAKYLYLCDDQTCPRHHHKTKSETFFVVKGTVEMEYEGTVTKMQPGDTLFVEAGKWHRFSGVGPALLLEVSMPCLIDDNFFEDVRIPIGGNYAGRADA